MELSGDRIRQLREALQSTFPDRPKLKQFLLEDLNRNLEEIVRDGNLTDSVSELIDFAVAEGRIVELVTAANRRNPGNPTLRLFMETSGLPFEDSNPNVPSAFSPGHAKIPHNLPRSGVIKFVGREEKLAQLHSQLQQNDRIAITAIAGMGGIGKTELALQYAIKQLKQNQYPAGICWLRARDREIATDIVTFAQVYLGLSLPEQMDIDDQVRFCWQRWPEGEALVVLDDVTNYRAIEPYLPPADPRFKLLITTRLDFGSTVQKVPLEELNEDGAIALLESLVGVEQVRSQLADAQTLCKWVGYLPLALELLGRFLARKLDWSICRLLRALEDKRLEAKALVETENGMTRQLGITAALELSWQELKESEQDLACMLGLFAIAPIPWSLVENCQPELEPDALEDIRDNGLMARSLLKRVGEGSYQLHQIVREYFRTKLHQSADNNQALKLIFCKVMVGIAKMIDFTPTITQIKQVEGVIVHLEEVANYHVDSLADQDLIHPFIGMGNFYKGTGNYCIAESWYENCLKISKIRLGEKHPDIANSLHHLACLYRAQARYQEAAILNEEALAMREHLFGEEHLDIARSCNELAGIYRLQGKHESSERLYERALAMRKLLAPRNPDVASSLNGLAILYKTMGLFAKAEILYKESLTMRQNLLGEDHSDFASSLNNLASLYREQGKYSEAEPLLLKALEKRKYALGEEHPYVAQSLSNLANLYRLQGKYEESELLFLKSLEIRRRIMGEEHLMTARSLSSLALIYSDKGELNKAEPLFFRSLAIKKHILGNDHLSIAMVKWSIGLLYQKQNKYAEAEDFYHQALLIAQSKLGSDHPTTQGILNSLNSLPQPPA
jgi:tetratricopeptide (TPR) repeat protein